MMFAAACTDASSDEAELRHVEGIYQVNSHTMNEQACSPDGATPVADTEHFVVATVQDVFGTPVLQLASCASVAACRDLAARMATDFVSFEYGFTLSRADGELALLGDGATTGFRDGNVCRLGDISTTKLIRSADVPTTLHIEKSITIADDYAAKDDVCDTNAAREAARGNACSQLETLTATFVEPL
jgi:hypothetical protein